MKVSSPLIGLDLSIKSKYKAIKYKEEMFRWMFMNPADFEQLETEK